MIQDQKESWAAEIAEHLKDRFGISVREVVLVEQGWLNVKWKMVTDSGALFVKYYHPERYKVHTHPDRRNAIEKTLQLQHRLSLSGIPCPEVHVYNEQFLQETPHGLYYTAQEWVEGYTAQAGGMSAV